MSSSAISPLNKHFVELDDPLATEVNVKVVMNSEAALTIDFDDVPVESMQLIDVQFKALIQDIVHEGPSFFDMNRIHTISEIFFSLFSYDHIHILSLSLSSFFLQP